MATYIIYKPYPLPAWKRRGPILVLALHNFVPHLLTLTLTHLLNSPAAWTHMGPSNMLLKLHHQQEEVGWLVGV